MNARAEDFAAVVAERVETLLRKTKAHFHWKRKIRSIYAENPDLGTSGSDGTFGEDARRYYRRWGVKISPLWHQAYYHVSDRRDVRYVPDDVFHIRLEPRLNRKDLATSYVDKNMLDRLLPEAQRPTTILRNMSGQYLGANYELLSASRAGELLRRCDGQYIVKPSIESMGGLNVRVLSVAPDHMKLNEVETGFEQLDRLYVRDFLVQERLKQNSFFDSVYPHSLNTIRVISLLLREHVHVLSAVFRMGGRGSYVDNYSAGGICCGVGRDGDLSTYAVNNRLKKFDRHPDTGFVFAGSRIPHFDRVRSLVESLHVGFPPHFRLVSWDIAMTEDNEPAVIEFNLRNQQVDFHQVHNGPLFGELTEEVFDQFLD